MERTSQCQVQRFRREGGLQGRGRGDAGRQGRRRDRLPAAADRRQDQQAGDSQVKQLHSIGHASVHTKTLPGALKMKSSPA
jgi:hypothetical protein